MNTNDDWKDEYYCAEVFVRVQYRHKILIRVTDGGDPEEATLKYLKSCSMQDLTFDTYRESWQDNPECDTEDDQFEIANLWDRGDNWDDCCLEDGAENEEAVIHPLMSLSYLNPCYQGDYRKDGYDEDGNLKPWGAYDCYGGVRTHDDYWDCNCDNGFNYIHKKSESLVCAVCESEEDDSPDSRVNEVAEKFGWDKEEVA